MYKYNDTRRLHHKLISLYLYEHIINFLFFYSWPIASVKFHFYTCRFNFMDRYTPEYWYKIFLFAGKCYSKQCYIKIVFIDLFYLKTHLLYPIASFTYGREC